MSVKPAAPPNHLSILWVVGRGSGLVRAFAHKGVGYRFREE